MAEKQPGKQDQAGATPLPESYRHRASMKWVTIESARIVMERLKDSVSRTIVLMTPAGVVEGELTDIEPSYSESFDPGAGGEPVPNITSMVANVRTDLLRLIEKEESRVELIDHAPLVGLKNVTLRTANQVYRLPEMTLFADQITGFSVSR